MLVQIRQNKINIKDKRTVRGLTKGFTRILTVLTAKMTSKDAVRPTLPKIELKDL